MGAAQAGYAVRTMCKAIAVSTSGYYAWRNRKPSARALDDARLVQRIERLHGLAREAYGTERMWQSLRQHGESCGRHRVQRLRRKHGIQSKRRRRYLRTRGTYQRVPAAPNLLAWPFASASKDRVWVADITYVPTRQGWLYLAAVLDLHTRRIVGWAMSDRADQALASDALDMALARRKPQKGVIHHSDQGVQYTCKAYQQQLHNAGLIASMSRKGMPYDNAMMEASSARSNRSSRTMSASSIATRRVARCSTISRCSTTENDCTVDCTTDHPLSSSRWS